MAKEEGGILQKLFDKSPEELEKIERELEAAPEGGVLAPEGRKKTMEELMEDIKRLRRESEENEEAPTPEVSLLFPDDSEFAQADDYTNPQFQDLEPNRPVSKEQQEELERFLVPALRDIYVDNLESTAQVLEQSQQLYDGVSFVAFETSRKHYEEAKVRGNPPKSNVIFGKNGLLDSTVSAAFEVAQTLGLPGSNDPKQYAAAMANAHRLVGQYIEEINDTQAMKEVEDLAVNVLSRGEDGEWLESPEQEQQYMQRSALSSAVSDGIYQGIKA